jgi:hypothetical protein
MLGWTLLGLFATAPAMAEPQPSIDIRWRAPSVCPQESDVRERLQKLLGPGRHDSHLRAEGTITRLERRFRLDLVVRGKDLIGTRSIESNSCDDLAGAAAVELGLLVHSTDGAAEPSRSANEPATLPPVREGAESSRSRADATDVHPTQETSEAPAAKRPPNDAKPERKTEVEREEASEPQPQVASQRSWRVLLQAPTFELDVGPLAQQSRGVGISLGLEYESWQLLLKGISWQRQNIPAPGFPGYGADVDRVGAALWGCRELRASWFGFSPCLTAGLERVSASGKGRNLVPSTQHAIGVTVGAGAQGRIHLASWIRVVAAVGGQIELLRPDISIAGEEPMYQIAVYQFAPAALNVAVGLEWIF